MKHYARFGAFDQHKDTILAAVAEAGGCDPQRSGRIPKEDGVIVRWLNRRLRAWRGL